jgi:hypothetical protein
VLQLLQEALETQVWSLQKIYTMKTPGYYSWLSMKARCRNTKHKSYKDYGGRGIKVCKEWDTYAGFLADMGIRPAGTTIERIDVNGDYEPRNCKWQVSKDQQKNTTRTNWVFYKGELLCLKDACKRKGIKYTSVRKRIDYYAWSIQTAFDTPIASVGRPRREASREVADEQQSV